MMRTLTEHVSHIYLVHYANMPSSSRPGRNSCLYHRLLCGLAKLQQPLDTNLHEC